MEEDNNMKKSDDSIKECVSLTDSPYVGGNKMSSSLKDRLKRSRMYSSPISRPVLYTSTVPGAPSSVKFANFTDAKIEEYPTSYSREEIENAMNEPEPEVKKKYWNDADQEINENLMIVPDLVINENTWNEPDLEMNENAMIEPDLEINDSACSSYSDQDFKNGIDKPHRKINENVCSYSKEDIENCEDKQELLEIYSNLQKEVAENGEMLRKLKLVQKHHTKNNPDALIDLTQKWLTCTQLALRKLYSFMPEPRSVSFENFLIFLQVDFDLVKYNPETDTFS